MLQISVFQVPKTIRSQIKRGSIYWPRYTKTIIRFLFSETMEDKEKEARYSFKILVHRFLGNTKDPLYKTIVQCMLTAYEAQGCKISLTVHFLHSHIEYFPENLAAYSKEQGKRFHQDVRDIE
ncbi:hypothetical protein AVEN_142271-1 [Araneus ventricosus]|uniref:Uncharacterized protein n=1 Tax=Araneus ventricosus TaxID=182803 RepID=A0A4Y2GLK7_ARAVE|nr:hypothetical protein AVEN_142271-1 [Araneus ventricosus]